MTGATWKLIDKINSLAGPIGRTSRMSEPLTGNQCVHCPCPGLAHRHVCQQPPASPRPLSPCCSLKPEGALGEGGAVIPLLNTLYCCPSALKIKDKPLQRTYQEGPLCSGPLAPSPTLLQPHWGSSQPLPDSDLCRPPHSPHPHSNN